MSYIPIVTTICLIIMIIGVVKIIVTLVRKNRKGRIEYIRSFKKGKGFLIYLIVLPLYLIANIYNNIEFPRAFFASIKSMVDAIVLKYDTSSIQKLSADNIYYQCVIYFCFILILINALLFVLSFINQQIWYGIKNLNFKHSKKAKLILFGLNDQNISIYQSEKNRKKMLFENLDEKNANTLYLKNINYKNTKIENEVLNKIINETITTNNQHIIIINTQDDERNISIGNNLISIISKLNNEDKNLCFKYLRIFIFGNPSFQSIYDKIVENSFGCISYINKYQKIAIDFIKKYPLSYYLNNTQIDYSTSLLNDNVNINVFFIGFGKTNKELFLTSLANNQFIYNDNNEIKLKNINYYIFDKDKNSGNKKNLNHRYNHYEIEIQNIDTNDYLPLPQVPANKEFFEIDINDRKFYETLKKYAKTPGKENINFFIISFGSDLENLDMGEKIQDLLFEWNMPNSHIFIKNRKSNLSSLYKKSKFNFFADENSIIYNINSITDDKLIKMAQDRDFIYNVEYYLLHNNKNISKETLDSIKEQSYRNWYMKKSQLERDSSVYCCLSLRFKLNLMGLDLVANENNCQGISEKEYYDIYAQNDYPNIEYYNLKFDNKNIIYYSNNFENSRRKFLACQEHLRWNSYMISKGITPASIFQILNEQIIVNGKTIYTNGKNYQMRHHGNITTFDGLITFRKLIANRDNKSEEECDVIRYDYQILDDAYWLLTKNGYSIIKK